MDVIFIIVCVVAIAIMFTGGGDIGGGSGYN